VERFIQEVRNQKSMVSSPGQLPVRRTYYITSKPICVN